MTHASKAALDQGKASPEGHGVYQLKITLLRTKPPIWRRVLVDDGIPLDELHDVIQVSMGWTDSHLHQFDAEGVCFRPRGSDIPGKNEEGVPVKRMLKKERDSLRYEYDFGDGWEHQILLERILPFEESERLPRCVKGSRACPPEDCGGPWGYENLLRALRDPRDEDDEELREWAGEDFDPEHFSADEVNRIFDAEFR